MHNFVHVAITVPGGESSAINITFIGGGAGGVILSILIVICACIGCCCWCCKGYNCIL